MGLTHYILKGHEAVSASLEDWTRWSEVADRRVAETTVGTARVSTVFLGLDHNFSDEGPPLLFETMVFGGPYDDYQDRYATWEDAARTHAEIVARLEAGLPPEDWVVGYFGSERCLSAQADSCDNSSDACLSRSRSEGA